MFGFRFNPPGPFWFEDLMFFVIDEGRRLPDRAAAAASRIRSLAERVMLFDPATLARRAALSPSQPTAVASPHREAALLDEPEAWALATQPLTDVGTGTHAAIALHKAAGEQLDALTYALDRLREELRPIMTYAPLKPEEDSLHALPTVAELDNSIEALLELSRQNAATRPKERVRTAA